MLVYFISKIVGLLFGLLYPAYASFLAVKNKDVRGYVHWMMYWIVFAFYTALESFTDTFLGPWFPFYYEFKICFLLWLMSPQTGGAGFLYRRFLHPKLVKYEPEIELCLVNVQNQTSSFVFEWANKIVSLFVQTVKETVRKGALRAASHEALSQHLLRTLSLNAISQAQPHNAISAARLPSSVGATPSQDLDIAEFMGNTRGNMNFNTSQDENSSSVFPLSEERPMTDTLSDGEVEIAEVPEPQPKVARPRRRRKEETASGSVNHVVRRKRGKLEQERGQPERVA